MFCGPYTQARENLRRRQGMSTSEAVSQQTIDTLDQVYEPDIDGRAFKNLIRYFKVLVLLLYKPLFFWISLLVFCMEKLSTFDRL